MEWVSTFLLIVIVILFCAMAVYHHRRIAALEKAQGYFILDDDLTSVIRGHTNRIIRLEQAQKGQANAITALQDSLIADCEDCGDDDDEEANPVSPPDGPTGDSGSGGYDSPDALADQERGNGSGGPLAMSGLLSADSGERGASAPVAVCDTCTTPFFAFPIEFYTLKGARDHGAMTGHTIRFLVEFGEGETVNPWALVGAP